MCEVLCTACHSERRVGMLRMLKNPQFSQQLPVPSRKAEQSHFESGDQSMHWISSFATFFHFQIGACCEARSQTEIVLKRYLWNHLCRLWLPVRSSTGNALPIRAEFNAFLEVLRVSLKNRLLLRKKIIDTSDESLNMTSFFWVFWDIFSLSKSVFIPFEYVLIGVFNRKPTDFQLSRAFFWYDKLDILHPFQKQRAVSICACPYSKHRLFQDQGTSLGWHWNKNMK